jgi:hypothetical protein
MLDEATGTHTLISTGGIEALAQAAASVHMMLSEAFEMYDRYRTSCQLSQD